MLKLASLRTEMRKQKIGIKELCKKSGVSQKNLKNWTALGVAPDLSQLWRVARILDLSIEELVFGSEWFERKYDHELVLYKRPKGKPKERVQTIHFPGQKLSRKKRIG